MDLRGFCGNQLGHPLSGRSNTRCDLPDPVAPFAQLRVDLSLMWSAVYLRSDVLARWSRCNRYGSCIRDWGGNRSRFRARRRRCRTCVVSGRPLRRETCPSCRGARGSPRDRGRGRREERRRCRSPRRHLSAGVRACRHRCRQRWRRATDPARPPGRIDLERNRRPQSHRCLAALSRRTPAHVQCGLWSSTRDLLRDRNRLNLVGTSPLCSRQGGPCRLDPEPRRRVRPLRTDGERRCSRNGRIAPVTGSRELHGAGRHRSRSPSYPRS
jgi:hypothetical protein